MATLQEFAVYKGDELVCIGSAKECAEVLNIKVSSVLWYTTPTAKKRFAKRKKPEKCMTCIRL